MMGHKICFYEEVLIIIPKLSLLLLLIWSPGMILSDRQLLYLFSYKTKDFISKITGIMKISLV